MIPPFRRSVSALALLALFLVQTAVVPAGAARIRTPDNLALGFDPAATLAAAALAKDAPLRYSVPLANIKPTPGPIRLVHAKSRQTITVAISDRFQAKDALLDVVFTNSIALLDDRSQLRFYWDDRLLAQVPLKSKQPEGRVTFRIPKEWLTGGYHPIRFEASQHYEKNGQCEDPMASELWTEIDTLHSSFSIIGDLKPVAPITRLSDLDVLLDPKLPDGEPIHFVTTRPTQVGDPRLTWLSLAAQGAALRLKYASLLATEGESLKPTGDQIVCATWQETSSLIKNMPSIPVKGGAIVLMPLPSDPRYFLLVLTGQTDDDVTQAVQAFAHADFSTVPASRVDLSTVSLPSLKSLTLAGRVKLGQTYNLSHFGYVTKVLRGMEAGDIQIVFKMPPDIYPSEDRQVAF
ncbi:MAG TPA: cellulose biosynthesis cyclic di-GMP-binding regulatory protein BcsB, partial [Candidatus Methylacidiphilales bacterium]